MMSEIYKEMSAVKNKTGKIRSRISFLTILILQISVIVSNGQNVSNGGFELWSGNCPVNTAPTGWTNFSTPVGLGPDKGGSCVGGKVSAYQGSAHMNLVWSNSGIREGAKQAVSGLTVGTTYQINFYAINDRGLWADTGSIILNFYHNSTIVFSTPVLYNGGPWTLYTTSFVALATTDTIGFRCASGLPGLDASVGVDAVSITSTTSINGTMQIGEYIVYPNPFEDKVSVATPGIQNATLSIQTLFGQTVLHMAELDSIHLKNIDLHVLPAGVYFLTLEMDGLKKTYRINKI